MKLTFNQSFEQSISIIGKAVEAYDFQGKLLDLQRYYLFHFQLSKSLPKSCRFEVLQFIRQFFKLLLLNMFGQRKQAKWRHQTIESSHKTKNRYCKLIQKLTSHKLINKSQIILFLITLIARNFLESIIDKNWRSAEQFEQENINQFQIEEYVYIVLTFQTAGNLVTPKAFVYLKNKHIKKIFYRNCGNTMGIIRSLKQIKKKLTFGGKILESKMKERDPEENSYLKFIRDNLKTKFKVRQQPTYNKDPVMTSMDHTFYNRQKTTRKVQSNKAYKMSKKIGLKQLSRAAMTNYKIKSQNCSKLFKKSPQKLQSGQMPTNYTTKFQIVAQQQQKKQKKTAIKNWKELINDLKNDSQRQVAKIDRVIFEKNKRMGRNIQSQSNTYHQYDQKYLQTSLSHQGSLRHPSDKHSTIRPSPPVQDQQQLNNVFYNLKSEGQRNLQRKFLFSHPFQWKFCRDLKKKQSEFERRCLERKEKIKDSFLNIPFKVQ